MKAVYLLPVLLLLLLVMPGAARTITAEGVSSYSMVADDGYVIYQITVNDLPIGTNQTHTLNYNGASYLLVIETYSESLGGMWKNADVSLTLPNGSTQTSHASVPDFVGQYKTHIQYVFTQSYSATNPFISVNLVVGVSPSVSASFNSAATGWNPSTSLAFTAVSGNLGGTTTVYIEEMPATDFQDHVVNYDPIYGISNLGSQIFQWTWSTILGFLNMIPVIGPITVMMITSMGGVIGTGYYWMTFVIMNFPAVLCGVECIICMMAVINAGKGKKSMGRLLKNVYAYNVAFAMGVISLVNIVWGWTKQAVEMITSIVQALKPI